MPKWPVKSVNVGNASASSVRTFGVLAREELPRATCNSSHPQFTLLQNKYRFVAESSNSPMKESCNVGEAQDTDDLKSEEECGEDWR